MVLSAVLIASALATPVDESSSATPVNKSADVSIDPVVRGPRGAPGANSGGKANGNKMIIIIAIAVSLAVLVTIVIVCYRCYKRCTSESEDANV